MKYSFDSYSENNMGSVRIEKLQNTWQSDWGTTTPREDLS